MQHLRINHSQALRPLAVGLCSLGLLAATVTFAGPAAAADAPSSQFIDAAATEFLTARNAQLVTGAISGNGASIAEASGLKARETKHSSALKDRRERLAAKGERYSAARTEASVVSTRQEGATLTARVNEKTRLDYVKVRGDEPPATEFSVNRDFVFQRSGGSWVLADVTLAEPDAVLPVNEVAPTVAPASAAPLPADATSADRRPAGKAEPQTKGASADGQVSTLAGYNYTAMVNYANQYWDNYNSGSYREYSNDCTNFISQIMYAGGWQYAGTNLAQEDSRRWDYNWGGSWTTSYTWAGAENWNQFAIGSGRTSRLPYLSDLLIADVLQIDFDRNSNINHTMVVTGTSGSEKYLTYHTNDTHDRTLTSILQSYPASTAWYYAHRT